MIAAVHLVWGPLGPNPLREFIASYRLNPAGVEHRLVVVLNGVREDQREAVQAELSGVEHELLTLGAPVQDLAAYVHAAQRTRYERLCFLNSYSSMLAAGWLAKMNDALDKPGVGMVGASGTWASVRSAALNALFLPNPYRHALPPRGVVRDELAAIELELAGERSTQPDRRPVAADGQPREQATSEQAPASRTLGARVLATLRTLPPMPEQLLRFQGFPAPHLRTNAFMIDRATLGSLKTGAIERKMDAYRLESGRSSITRQLHRQGLKTLVVDRDGAAYDVEQWPGSRTLWQGDQENLLVADNQTRVYASGGLDRRALLSAFAWGPQADPRVPGEARRSAHASVVP